MLAIMLIAGCFAEAVEPEASPLILIDEPVFVFDESEDLTPIPDETINARQSLAIEFAEQARQQYEVTAYTADWCIPCKLDHDRNGDGDDRVTIKWTNDTPPAGLPTSIPLYTWRDASGSLRYRNPVGRSTLDEIVASIERNDPPQQVMQSGPYGATIRGRRQIESMIDTWKRNVGDAKVQLTWDRSGVQSVDLLHTNEWKPIDILGRTGEFSIRCDRAVSNLRDLSAGYRFDSDGKTLIAKLETRFDFSSFTPSVKSSSDGVGIDPLTVITAFSILRGVWQLLHPSVDLQLPGEIAATAKLSDDMLSITFEKFPSVRVKAWLAIQAGVKQVDIAMDHVRVEFTGSRLLRERMIEVIE